MRWNKRRWLQYRRNAHQVRLHSADGHIRLRFKLIAATVAKAVILSMAITVGVAAVATGSIINNAVMGLKP